MVWFLDKVVGLEFGSITAMTTFLKIKFVLGMGTGHGSCDMYRYYVVTFGAVKAVSLKMDYPY